MRFPKRRNIQASAGTDQDPLPYYYMPIIGAFYRKRLSVALDLLGPGNFRSLLEIGYGSGIFLPQLSVRCDRLVGIDMHDNVTVVQRFLGIECVTADLCSASIADMPFSDDSFDCVVCMSVLEHVTAVERAMREIRRVLTRNGVAVIGFPTRNVVSSFLISLLGFNPITQHPNDHNVLLAGLSSLLPPQRIVLVPPFLPVDYGLYVLARCVKE